MKHAAWTLLMVVVAGCDAAGTRATADAPAETKPVESAAAESKQNAPTADVRLSIVSYEGILEQVARHRGKVVVMDAWSTSCPPCLKEFHNLVELHKKYGPDKVACISLSFDYEGIGTPEDQQGKVLDFLRGQGATFDNLMSNEESDVLYKKFKLAAIPAVFVFDRQGELRKRFDNERAKSKTEAFSYEQVGALVAELLDAKAPQGDGL